MSSAPDPSEPVAFDEAAREPAAADLAADAALIVAALGRMEAAIRDDRSALGRLRDALGEMAQAIAAAKEEQQSADAETAAALLDEFEHRVDAMIEIAGGKPAKMTEAQADAQAESEPEFDQVPTVSGVVAQHGPESGDDDASPQAATEAGSSSPEPASGQAPTVAMLTAMVQALTDSIAETAAQPSVDADDQESALLASFQQMGSWPIPPPDEGTAVIFSTAPEPPPEPAIEPSAKAVTETQAAESEFDPSDFLFGPEPESEPAEELLDPAPPPVRAVVLPQPEFVRPPQNAPQAEPPAAAGPADNDVDPLHALKAMSEEEKIALFT